MEQAKIRLPSQGEVLGVVERMLGAYRMQVKCSDGKRRVCRIPGRLLKRVWIKEGDIVIIKPWELQAEEKGDVVYKYQSTELLWLREKGYLKALEW